MSALINLPRAAWKRQPKGVLRVNANHSLSTQLAFAVDYSRDITPVDLLGGTIGTYQTAPSDTLVATTPGKGTLFNKADLGNTNNFYKAAWTLLMRQPLGTVFSLLGVGSAPTHLVSGTAGFSCVDAVAGEGITRTMQHRINSNRTHSLIRFGSSAATASTLAAPTDDLVVSVAVSNGNAISIHANGGSSGTATIAGTPVSMGTTLYLNTNYLTNGRSLEGRWGGNYYLNCGWYRALTAAEATALAENPWQLFIAHSPRAYFIPADVAVALPTLSSATAINITSGGFQPRVTATY